MEIENDSRSSLERDLMVRDREGQLYLEARRQRALVDLLDTNRTSFLSTITPPSTNPPSAASSLFQEPLATPTYTEATARPATCSTRQHSASASEATASASYPTPFNTPSTTAAIQNVIPAIKKKTRQRSPSGRGRTLVPEPENRPIVPISTSSLEYQLTANLLKFHHAPPSSSGTRSRSRSRSKPRLHKPRSATLGNDAKIDSYALTMISRGTGYARAKETADEQEVLADDVDERTGASTFVAKPASAALRTGSIPSSPTSMLDSSSSKQGHSRALVETGVVPPSNSPSPPLPPLPPKSPRSLIAHYFPGSLPPPPARCRPRHVQKTFVLAPRPFKTPTFGPAFATKPRAAATPPMPSPSSSLQYLTVLPPSAPLDDVVSFSSPSPSISAFGGPTVSVTSIQQPRGLPSDLDLSISNSARARSHLHQQQQQQPYSIPLHSNNSNISAGGARDPASLSSSLPTPPSVSFSPLTDPEVLSGARLVDDHNNDISSTKTTWATSSVIPVYPRDLMPIASTNMSGSSNNHSSSHGISMGLNSGPQKIIKPAVPYIRELIPGREDPLLSPPFSSSDSDNHHTTHNSVAERLTATTMTSPNTSRDLEMVLEEITGRVYTTRTSMGPWSAPLPSRYLRDWPDDGSSISSGGRMGLEDEKSLPPIRREKGSRYWVFRTSDGDIVPGPFLFLLGHLCPILWWIGSVYPSIEHPDHKHRRQQQQRAVVPPRSRKDSVGSIGSERGMSYDDPTTTTISMAAQADKQDENPVLHWFQRQLRAASVRITSITTTSRSFSPSPPPSPSSRRPKRTDPEQQRATLQVVHISQDDNLDRGAFSELPEAGLTTTITTGTGHISHNSSWIHVPARVLFPAFSTMTTTAATAATTAGAAGAASPASAMNTTTMPRVEDGLDIHHGPWSAADNDAYLFELRIARDRKLLRYELDLSWRRINLIWSLGSFVLALTITAIVLTVT
ncbi:hypothetical protein BGZ70_002848 [Mortierella alpina]|uniref:Uncharacterized protein n=1 Tax=Mortierella alpina TaxID=64518 RepID=A0A9P6JBD8_MORAP|nr:hypothetical protein BGZ70_002848 [Mortierella alpina]